MKIDFKFLNDVIPVLLGMMVALAPIYNLFVWKRETIMALKQLSERVEAHINLGSHPRTLETLSQIMATLAEIKTDILWIQRGMGIEKGEAAVHNHKE